jgi:hypothetical protein
MTTTKANSSVLTAADILRGGDNGVRRATVKKLVKNGEPAVVCYLPISAAAMMKFQEERLAALAGEAAGENPRHVERMVDFLQRHLVQEDGSPLFDSADQLSGAPVEDLTEILKAVTGQTEDEAEGGAPNASSGAPGSASPTESLPS